MQEIIRNLFSNTVGIGVGVGVGVGIASMTQLQLIANFDSGYVNLSSIKVLYFPIYQVVYY